MTLDWLGGLLGMLDPFTRVSNYLKNVKETHEVKDRLSRVLGSVRLYMQATEASNRSGNALAERLDRLDPPISSRDAVEVLTMSAKFYDDYRAVFRSIRQFGRECRATCSGDLTAFMEKVKANQPDVYDLINFFGRNYDPKTDSLDLTNLPTVLLAWGSKAEWKENDELSETVREGREFMERMIKKAKIIQAQKIVVRDRSPRIQFISSLNAISREAKRFRSTKEAEKQLRNMAPSWFLGVAGIVDDVRKALPGPSRSALR